MWTLNKMVQRNLFTKQVATDVETDMVSVECGKLGVEVDIHALLHMK